LILTNIGSNFIQVSSTANNNWTSIASSSSGEYQIACVSNGSIYSSSNYGESWSSSNSPNTLKNWKSVAMSACGQYQTVVIYNGVIYYSQNFGSFWTAQSTTANWQSVAVSASGQYQTAVATSGYIYTSTNFGKSWSQQTTTALSWKSVAVSASGQYQTAIVFGSSSIYTSTNYGSTWNTISVSSSNLNWCSVDISVSGQYQTALVYGYNIYISSDYGNSWSYVSGTSNYWLSVGMSESGQYQVASTNSTNGSYYYTSSDYGNSWTRSSTGIEFSSLSMSSNGQYIIGCVNGGSIYTCKNSIVNGVVSVGSYSSTSGVTGTIGSIYYDTTYSQLKVSSGSQWISVGSGSGLNGIIEVSTDGKPYGATLTSNSYLQLAPATETYPGVITTSGQTMSGSKNFTSDMTVNTITVGLGGSNVSTNTV
jgi:hypothetical protein